MTPYLRAALDIFELTEDPLMLDAVRSLAFKGTPVAIRETVQKYVLVQHECALQLFKNSGKYPKHDYGLPTSTGGPDA